jgi:hypothetical protein
MCIHKHMYSKTAARIRPSEINEAWYAAIVLSSPAICGRLRTQARVELTYLCQLLLADGLP